MRAVVRPRNRDSPLSGITMLGIDVEQDS